ncbi:secreted RxLR effector protein 161-like [Nicotiana tomentosiformis]|uniref:secreted RxLR effector protein 161-like n=1 Tax=Nicotiana tomentosiformis TaxID=4098 RepID=UPI00388CA58A
MDSSKSIDTPIIIATKLDLDEEGKSVEQKLYRGMIGSLLYLTTSRPDIVFSVGLCARFQENPKESHLKAVKRILRYLKGSPDLRIWYPRGYNFDLVGYADVDYAVFHVDRKSTSGTVHFLGYYLVSWGTKKQNSVALSTSEVEYVVATYRCAQLLWIRQQLRDYGIFAYCVPLFYDNTRAINIAKIHASTRELIILTLDITFSKTMLKRGISQLIFVNWGSNC